MKKTTMHFHGAPCPFPGIFVHLRLVFIGPCRDCGRSWPRCCRHRCMVVRWAQQAASDTASFHVVAVPWLFFAKTSAAVRWRRVFTLALGVFGRVRCSSGTGWIHSSTNPPNQIQDGRPTMILDDEVRTRKVKGCVTSGAPGPARSQ